MRERGLAVVILAAGKSRRMKTKRPKVLHEVAGQPMVARLMATVETLAPDRTVLVIGPDMQDEVSRVLPGTQLAIQDPPRGTGHAVMAAREALDGFEGDVLVLFGDSPMVSAGTLTAMIAARRDEGDPAVVVMGFEPDDTAAYARLIIGPDGGLDRIVEYEDASDGERTIRLCNSGFMVVDGGVLFDLLDQLNSDNAQGEYYLTDIVAVARAGNRRCAVVRGGEVEAMGINSRAELAAAEMLAQRQLREAAMSEGVTLIDPTSVHFSHDTVVEADVVIEPNVFFGPGAVVKSGAVIRAFSHLEGCTVASGAIIGPFARLRPDADVGTDARIGNFVEVKNATIEAGAKINHLSYVGDARVGAAANVGAGTITCNYDGFMKSHTDIGAGAFIGSNTALVAPVSVGDGAIVGAGSTITKDVAPEALAVERAEQQQKSDFAPGYRARRQAEKDKQAAKKKKKD
jgi:bifunctional UDP-N-acetylglucosamine pyrophosphorylase/glucosamine-1-phosphate N-acetyltransferase